jgi:hypothetical protein
VKHATIIKRLGGNGVVSRALGKHFTTVSHWRRFGIPAAQWHRIVRLADDADITLDVETLARHAPRFRDEERAIGKRLPRAPAIARRQAKGGTERRAS